METSLHWLLFFLTSSFFMTPQPHVGAGWKSPVFSINIYLSIIGNSTFWTEKSRKWTSSLLLKKSHGRFWLIVPQSMLSCEVYGSSCLTIWDISPRDMILWAMPQRCNLGTLSKSVLVLTPFVPLQLKYLDLAFRWELSGCIPRPSRFQICRATNGP